MICSIYLAAHVAGWNPYSLHHLARTFPGLDLRIHRSCTNISQRQVKILMIDILICQMISIVIGPMCFSPHLVKHPGLHHRQRYGAVRARIRGVVRVISLHPDVPRRHNLRAVAGMPSPRAHQDCLPRLCVVTRSKKQNKMKTRDS